MRRIVARAHCAAFFLLWPTLLHASTGDDLPSFSTADTKILQYVTALPGRTEKRDNPPVELTPHDKEMVARAVLGEAGAEETAGQQAVAHVIRNRLILGARRLPRARAFGQTVREVLKQFDAMDRKKGGPAYKTAVATPVTSPALQRISALVEQVFAGQLPDNTHGALFYYNPATTRRTPGWVADFVWQNDIQIGRHRFLGKLPVELVEQASERLVWAGPRPAV